ncbi:hypothetical protein CEUSTIGMA_g9627.t1, partial [Chlamydomonas eustigma]
MLGTPSTLIGAYCPAQTEERDFFFSELLPSSLPPPGARQVLLAGDFNCVISEETDVFYPPGHPGLRQGSSRLHGSACLGRLMQDHSLVDIWRDQHPADLTFTHWSKASNSGARLDRWLLSPGVLTMFERSWSQVLSSSAIHTDHLPAILSFAMPKDCLKQGRGVLAFPLLLLNLPSAAESLRSAVQAEAACLFSISHPGRLAVQWNEAKARILLLSHRLHPQSAFIHGRDISDNVRYHQGLRARLKELGTPAHLLLSDLTKAYDSVDRGLVLRAMSAQGFREQGIIRWVQLMSSGTSCTVRINGTFTPFFPTVSGLEQGSSLSCHKWVIVWQLFFAQLNKLQASGTLPTFPLPNGEIAPPSLGYADDDNYILIGELSDLALKIKRLFEEENCRQAFSKVPGTMRLEGLAWNCAQPNKLGRAHISVLNLASKAIYQAAFHKPPANLVAAMQQQVNRFVAKPSCFTEESPIPTQLYHSANMCFLPKKAGGLSFPDLNSHFTAMRAKPCWKIFVRSVHPWQQLFRHEVSKAGPAEAFGADWVVRNPVLVHFHRIPTLPFRDAVEAFSLLNMRRLHSPEEMDPYAVLLEPLLGNPDIRLSNSHHVLAVIEALPNAWQTILTQHDFQEPEWSVITSSQEKQVLLKGPQTEDPYWEALPTGAMIPYSGEVTPSAALVQYYPKPAYAWSREVWNFYKAQQNLAVADRQRVLEPRLLGIWDEMDLDPRGWGFSREHHEDSETNATESAEDRQQVTGAGQGNVGCVDINLVDMT